MPGIGVVAGLDRGWTVLLNAHDATDRDAQKRRRRGEFSRGGSMKARGYK